MKHTIVRLLLFISRVKLSNRPCTRVFVLFSVSVWYLTASGVSSAADSGTDSIATSAAGPLQSPIGAVYLLKMVLALALVLGVFFLLAKIAGQIKGIEHTNSRILGVLTGVSLGARERLVIVQAGDVQMLLGISPSGIVKLREFEKDVILTDDGQVTEPFKAKMEKLLGRTK